MIIHSSQPIFRVLHLILYGYYIILLNNWYVVTFCIEIFVILHGKNKQKTTNGNWLILIKIILIFTRTRRTDWKNWPKKLTRRSFLNSFSNNQWCSFAINSAKYFVKHFAWTKFSNTYLTTTNISPHPLSLPLYKEDALHCYSL